ncbi:MAG: 3-isopropylmalate dehydratase large subunit [Clostridiaceae bacterium]|jgi:3-isopropylmalate/(R)-2-methylmalate dehydratase large subunit|nr:3-isopropylmalate dehydratase large subunit [Clostridiaceae bacterium]
MGMTMTQKNLARHAGRQSVAAGELIEAKLDLVMGNDVTAPPAIDIFQKTGSDSVFDKSRVVLVPDHFTPNKDIKSAQNCKQMRLFAQEHGLENYYEVGSPCHGIEHVILPENGLVVPGDAVIGADSHTCTYGALGLFSTGVGSTDLACAMVTGSTWFRVPEAMRFVLKGSFREGVAGKDLILYIIGRIGVDGALYRSMEFTGPGVASLTMADRFTVCNMVIEAGAKNGIFPVDEATLAYMAEHAPDAVRDGKYTVDLADEDAEYVYTMEIDLSELPYMAAFPHLPDNTRQIGDHEEVRIDQVVIGSCTNGRLEDMRAAAAVLRGRTVAPGVRCLVIPGSNKVWAQSLKEGLLEIFAEAGAIVSAATCGPCLGGHMGILAEGERCVSTTNRNFVGRMGHPGSEVYLTGAPAAAASAVLGRLASPEEL